MKPAYFLVINGKVVYKLTGYVQAKLAGHSEEILTNFMTEAIKPEEVTECY